MSIIFIGTKDDGKGDDHIHRKRQLTKLLFVICILAGVMIGLPYKATEAKAATKKTYTITVKTKPVGGKYIKSKSYNSKTKHYYMLRSYLEYLEKQGGGTLVLKKGVYEITNTLCIPSNVTVKLSSGTVLRKLTTTGVKKMAAANTMFYLVPPSKENKKDAAYTYNGSKNVTILGATNAVLDMNGSASSAIFMAHNYNVLIKGLTIKNSKGSVYTVTIDGCKKVKITNLSISGEKAKTTGILLDLPAKGKKNTKVWVKQDNTTNYDITISNCSFSNLLRGIASVRFIKDRYQGKVAITKNTFANISGDVIRGINLDAPVITNNKFTTIGVGTKVVKGLKSYATGIYLGGVKNPLVSSNTFTGVPLPILVAPYTNTDKEMRTGTGKTKNNITSAQLTKMRVSNSCKNCFQPYIKYYNNSVTKKYMYYFNEGSKKTYRVTPSTLPYNMDSMARKDYTSTTRHFFMLQSYLFQIEANGGGTLLLGPGVYKLPAEVSVGSNTAIQFESGAIVRYITKNVSSSFKKTTGMFALVSPRGAAAKDQYSGYNGVRNVRFIGPKDQNGVIDANGVFGCSILMCHNYNISFTNLRFVNMNNGHFIELDASKNVLIKNCIFSGYGEYQEGTREAINLDIPDKYTKGFVREWTTYDKTPCDTITICNTTFSCLTSAIGSHHYTDKGWHTNITISNNTFTSISYHAIRIMQMDGVTIENNTFTNIGLTRPKSATYMVCMEGVRAPQIRYNNIQNGTAFLCIRRRRITGNAVIDAYPVLSNSITEVQINDMVTTNSLVDVKSSYLWITDVVDATKDMVTKYYAENAVYTQCKSYIE